jgi:hypothetical protein
MGGDPVGARRRRRVGQPIFANLDSRGNAPVLAPLTRLLTHKLRHSGRTRIDDIRNFALLETVYRPGHGRKSPCPSPSSAGRMDDRQPSLRPALPASPGTWRTRPHQTVNTNRCYAAVVRGAPQLSQATGKRL